MKPIKLENRIAYFIILHAIFLLNYNNLSFLSIIIGSLISLFTILLFEKINIYRFKITKLFIFFLSIFLLTYYLNKISYFIGDNILRNYSIIIIGFTLLLTIFFLGNKGYHTIIKVIILSSYFLFFITLLGLLLAIFYVKINNINKFILTTNNLFFNTITYSLSLIYGYFLVYPTTNTKFKIKDLLISSSFNILNYLLSTSILGVLINYLKYPYVDIFKKVNLLGFIERIEIIFTINYLYFFFFLLLLIYYQIYFLLKSKFKKKQLTIPLVIISFLIFLFSMIF